MAGVNASPYFAISDLAKSGRQAPTAARS